MLMLKPIFSKFMTTVLVGNVLLAVPFNPALAYPLEPETGAEQVSYYMGDPTGDKLFLDAEERGHQTLRAAGSDESLTASGARSSRSAPSDLTVLEPVPVVETIPVDLKAKTAVENETEYIEFINAESNFDVKATIAKAYSEVGTSRPTGWSAEGECIMSAKRWIEAGGGTWGQGGTPLNNYAPATEVDPTKARPGDVVQYIYTSSPDSWVSGIHTVLITGVNKDGSFKIVESNNPGGSGLVTKNDNWLPKPPTGFTAKFFRF